MAESRTSLWSAFLALVFGCALATDALAESGVVSYTDINKSLIYIDIQGKLSRKYRKGKKITIRTVQSGTKKIGKIKSRIGRRIIVEVDGGLSDLYRGSKVILKTRRKSTKSLGNFGIVQRDHTSFKNRINFSVMGEAMIQPGSFLMYGGGAGITLPWDLEVEGFFLIGNLPLEKANVDGQFIHGNVKAFISNSLYGMIGGGYRSFTVTKVTEKDADKKDGEEEAPAETEADESQTPVANQNYSDDVVAEIGGGLRWRIRTLVLGRGFIIGIEGGFQMLLSVADSSPTVNPALESAFPLPNNVMFGRAHVGLTF